MSGTFEQHSLQRFKRSQQAVIGGKWTTAILKFARNTSGATAVEYGLLAGLIAVGLAGGLGALADLVNLVFNMIGQETADVTNAMADP